jgi:prolipoprotein diacylglyceryl transferase
MLGYIPSPPSNGISIGPLRLHLYGFLIVAGVFAAVWLSDRRWRARGGEPGTFSAIALWAVPGGLIGARLYHVATDYELYTHHPLDAFKIWQGGLGIWGGIAGGVLAGWLYIRRHDLDFAAILDCVAPALPLAQAIGRWGNYFNQELFGRPTTLPWGLKIDIANRPQAYANSATFHPTFLYESLWDLAVVGLVLLVEKRTRLKKGYLFAVYVSLYTFGRFFTEYLRIDFAHKILGLRINDWMSIIVFLTATIVLLTKGRERSQPREEGQEGAPEDEAARRPALVGAGARPPAGATAVDGETIDEATTGFLADMGRPSEAEAEVPASAADSGDASTGPGVTAAVGAPEATARGDSGTEGAQPAAPEPASGAADGDAATITETRAEVDDKTIAQATATEYPASPEPDQSTQPTPASQDGAEAKPSPESELASRTAPQPEPAARAEPQAEPAAQAEPQAESAVHREPEPQQAPPTEPEPKPVAQPEPEPEPAAQAEPEPEPAAQAKPQEEPAAQAKAEAESAARAEAEPEPTTEPDPELAAQGQPEPTQGSAAGDQPEATSSASDRADGAAKPDTERDATTPVPSPEGAAESPAAGGAPADGGPEEGGQPQGETGPDTGTTSEGEAEETPGDGTSDGTDEDESAGRVLAGDAAAARRTLGWPFRRREERRD